MWSCAVMFDESLVARRGESETSKRVERTTDEVSLRTWMPIPSITCEPMAQFVELSAHERLFDTMLDATGAASMAPHSSAVREQHAQLLRGRDETRSAIRRLQAALNSERTRRLRSLCAQRDTDRPNRRLVVRSVRNSRASCRARRVARVARTAAKKATGDPDPDSEPPRPPTHPLIQRGASGGQCNTGRHGSADEFGCVEPWLDVDEDRLSAASSIAACLGITSTSDAPRGERGGSGGERDAVQRHGSRARSRSPLQWRHRDESDPRCVSTPSSAARSFIEHATELLITEVLTVREIHHAEGASHV